MNITNAVNPTPEQAMAFFAAPDDGPFVMINLLKFKERAEYPDGSDAHLTGAEAYARYGAGVQAELAKVGGKAHYAGRVTGLMIGAVDDNWDMVALAEYPSLAALKTMVMSESYQAIAVHRTAGLAGQLNIRTSPMGARR
ncbi:MAG: DUF1330 domain-containing protein [Pseudomonadota bacterium]